MLLKEKYVMPNKSLFNIQEVCSLIGVKSYVLRFWETEFDQICPVTNNIGEKNYERKDIEVVGLIKKLLFEDKLSIEKAKFEVDRIYSSLIVGQSYVAGALKEEDNKLAVIDIPELPIIDSDYFEKIDLVKSTLFDIIGKTNDIKSKYHWS